MPRALFFLMGCLVALVAVVGAIAITVQQSGTSAHRIGGPFELVDINGKRVNQNDLSGRPAVLYFGYTSCPDVCPTTLAMLTNVMAKMGSRADRLNVVFVTIDPQRDTREAMKLYLASFDSRIRGWTGSEAQVADMANTFHIYRRRSSDSGTDYSMAHSANALLLNEAGRLAGEIYYGEDEASVMAKLTTMVPEPICRAGAPGPADLWSHAATRGPGQLCGAT